MRYKELDMDYQQTHESTLKEKAMEHLLATCDRRECLALIAKAYDRITYYDNKELSFSGLYGRGN
jgi:hypothetical protein